MPCCSQLPKKIPCRTSGREVQTLDVGFLLLFLVGLLKLVTARMEE